MISFPIPRSKPLRILLAVAAVLVAIVLLPTMLPFLIGLAIALVGRSLGKRLFHSMPVALSTCICVTGLLLLTAFVLFILMRQLIEMLGNISADLPGLLAGLSEPVKRFQIWMQGLSDRLPDGFGTALQGWSNSLLSGSSTLVASLSERLLGFATGLLAALPDAILFLVTMVLSCFFFACALPKLQNTLPQFVPANWMTYLSHFRSVLRDTLGGWVKAQLILMAFTFGILTVGLFILGYRYAILFGLGIALIDALPVLGVGSVLIPWSLLQFLRGDIACGVGLLVLWGISSLTRSALEPRILGKQLGLPPLVALFAMYGGYKLFGVAGMLLCPIGAILARQIFALSNGAKPSIIEKTSKRGQHT